MKKIHAITALTAVFLLTACSSSPAQPKLNYNAPANGQNSSNQTASTSNVSTDSTNQNNSTPTTGNHDQLIAKINPYIDCLNQQSKAVLDARNYYLNWVDPATGPTGKEAALLLPYTTTIADCVQNIQQAEKSAPSLPDLEKAGETYIAALQKIDPLLKKASAYYDQKNYKDDNLAQGKSMHKELMADWDEFAKADQSIRDQVDKINDGMDEQELADLEKTQGRTIPFLLKNTIHSAKLIANQSESGDLKNIDLDAFNKALDAFDKADSELENYISAHAQDPKALPTTSFTLEAKDFLKASKDLMRRVRDKQPYSDSDKMMLGGATGWMVDGSPEKVLYEYNKLVDNYNVLVQTL